jgi:imidazole glycerol-phosphate synthase subunit HisH
MTNETLMIIDYGSGNLRSAEKSFERVITQTSKNVKVIVSANPEDLKSADRIVLPGQGAFRDCMSGLSGIPGMVEALNDAVLKKGKPFLGICVGMQLMATRGLEHGSHAGLNWITGQVVPMRTNDVTLKIPHMGWNDLILGNPTNAQDNRHFVLRSTDSADNFYFVHSFVFKCDYNHHVLAQADYGGNFPAIVGRDNMIGVQFHPEKSATAGLNLLSSFLDWKP